MPKVTTLLADAEKLVVEAEKLGYEVLKTTRAFMELIQHLGDAKAKAQSDLDALGSDAGG